MKKLITIAACGFYVFVLGGATDTYEPPVRGYYDDDGMFHAYSKSHPPPPEAPAPPQAAAPSRFEPRSRHMRQDSSVPPPARFDYRPDRVIEVIQSLEEIQKTCAPRAIIFRNVRWGGCSIVRKGGCRVYLADTPNIERVRRHEYGHCNGWSSNHEP